MTREITEVSFSVEEEDFKPVEHEIDVSNLRSTGAGSEH